MSGFEELHYCFSQLGTIVHSIKNNYYLFIMLILPVFIKKKIMEGIFTQLWTKQTTNLFLMH